MEIQSNNYSEQDKINLHIIRALTIIAVLICILWAFTIAFRLDSNATISHDFSMLLAAIVSGMVGFMARRGNTSGVNAGQVDNVTVESQQPADNDAQKGAS